MKYFNSRHSATAAIGERKLEEDRYELMTFYTTVVVLPLESGPAVPVLLSLLAHCVDIQP